MKNNRIHSLFNQKGRLDRKDIEMYGQTSDEKVRHAIEKKSLSSEFDTDALEGWSDLRYKTSVMARLDRRFLGMKAGYAFIYSMIVITAGVITIMTWPEAKESRNDKQDHVQNPNAMAEIILDESDVLLPESIEAMKEAPANEQMNAKTIREDFKEIKQLNDDGFGIQVKELPVIQPEPIPDAQPEIASKRSIAKEVYLADLKLIDYREYRSAPVVKTKQIILSGVPANKENEFSEEDEPEWREIEIPYIEFIDKSVRIFNKGSYKKALTRFQTVLKTYDNDVNALFYGGLCLYNLKEYTEAITMFQSCLKSEYTNFDEEAQWMMALSYEKSGDPAAAKQFYRIIADQKGFYASQAREKLK